MVSNILFDRTAVADLELSLDASAMRHKVHANNVANAETPCYRAREVSFEDEYRRSLGAGNNAATLTHEDHIPIGTPSLDSIRPVMRYAADRMNDSGVNNVDIDHEMAEIAKDSIRYEMDLNLLKKKFTNLRDAIRGRS